MTKPEIIARSLWACNDGRSGIEACIAKGCHFKGKQRVEGIADRKPRESWKGIAVEQVKPNACVAESLCDFLTPIVALHTFPRKYRSARFLRYSLIVDA